MHTRYLITQLQIQVAILAAAGLQEYTADWLKQAKTVYRDENGRFAMRGADPPPPFNEAAKTAKQLKLLRVQDPQELADTSLAMQSLGLDPDAVFNAVERSQSSGIPQQKYTLTERVNELARLSKKKDLGSKLALDWHKGILQSEVRYGQLIDDIVKTDPWDQGSYALTSKLFGGEGFGASYDATKIGDEENSPRGTRSAYHKLMAKLKKGESRVSADEATQSLLDEMSKPENLKRAGFKLFPGTKLRYQEVAPESNIMKFIFKSRINQVIKATKEFGELINVDIPKVHIGMFYPDATFLGKPIPTLDYRIGFVVTDLTPKDTIVNAGITGFPEVLIFHELGHALERAKKLTPMAWNYIDSRTDSKGKTDFPYAYTPHKYGKDPSIGNSELISTATQMLTSSRDVHRAAVIDREHLMLGLYALDKEV